jgi:hypothetical protein
MTTESGPAGADIQRDPAHRKRGNTVDIAESSVPHAHPSTDDHDDTIEAHYACLERPCACYEGIVYLGRITLEEDGEEEEVIEAVPCRRCQGTWQES